MKNAISVKLSPEIKDKLDTIAKNTERSRSQVIRLAIKQLLLNGNRKKAIQNEGSKKEKDAITK